MKSKIIALILFIALFSSCYYLELQQQRRDWADYLNSQIGTLSYDQALSKWGAPAAITQGDEIFVAQWSSENSVYAVVPSSTMIVAGNISHGWIRRITFDKITKKMTTWSYENW